MQRGLTLVEIIVVLVILGILTTLALSQFGQGRERALSREAVTNLKLIAAAERLYKVEIGFYYPYSGSQGDVSSINTNLKLLLKEDNWDYTVSSSSGDGSTFTAYANRQAGAYSGCQYNLAYDDSDGEPEQNGSCAPPY